VVSCLCGLSFAKARDPKDLDFFKPQRQETTERGKRENKKIVSLSLSLPLWFLVSVVYLLLRLGIQKTWIFLNHRDKKPQRREREEKFSLF